MSLHHSTDGVIDYRIIGHDGTLKECCIDGRRFERPIHAVQYLMNVRGLRLKEAMEYVTTLVMMTE